MKDRNGVEDMGETPMGLNVLSILYIVEGIFWLIYPVFYAFLLAGYLQEYYGHVPLGHLFANTICCWIGSIIIASIYFGIAAGLKKGMPSAWIWAIVFAIIGLFNVPIGTIISIVILVYLFTPNVKEWFKKGGEKQQKMMDEMQKKREEERNRKQ
ncbi:hypothetical protein [Aciduliprofundum sp. MAR08-339]|uniref:hypothetical protein n=1 Tax=Aciduliprofundum sp. (strain MAR08-339) TaxID=673860 RepID=UPI000A051F27